MNDDSFYWFNISLNRNKKLGCKILFLSMIMTLDKKIVPANLVPAAAVIREGRALFGIIGRKAFVDGIVS